MQALQQCRHLYKTAFSNLRNSAINYEIVTKINIRFKIQNIYSEKKCSGLYKHPPHTLTKTFHTRPTGKARKCQKSYLADRFIRLALYVLLSKSIRQPCRYSIPNCMFCVIL